MQKGTDTSCKLPVLPSRASTGEIAWLLPACSRKTWVVLYLATCTVLPWPKGRNANHTWRITWNSSKCVKRICRLQVSSLMLVASDGGNGEGETDGKILHTWNGSSALKEETLKSACLIHLRNATEIKMNSIQSELCHQSMQWVHTCPSVPSLDLLWPLAKWGFVSLFLI